MPDDKRNLKPPSFGRPDMGDESKLDTRSFIVSGPDNEPVIPGQVSEHSGNFVRLEGADLALLNAERQLQEHGGFDWLLSSDKQFWSVSEIVAELEKVGLKVSNDAVIRWVKPLAHTQDFGGPVGLRATKRDLIKLFAQMQEKNRERKRKGRVKLERGYGGSQN